MPRLLKPASGVDVRGVSVQPEIMALRVAIEVEAHPVTAHLPAGRAGKGNGHGNLLLPLAEHRSRLPSRTQSQHITRGSQESVLAQRTIGGDRAVPKGTQHGAR